MIGLTNGLDDAPKAGSVTMVLQQALHSRDKKQITAILRNKDLKLIKVNYSNNIKWLKTCLSLGDDQTSASTNGARFSRRNFISSPA